MTLRTTELKKSFGRIEALKSLSFEAKEGQIMGLIGPNGSGKSTTFRIILGLLDADQGQVTWQDQPIRKLPKEAIGFLPEERGLYPKLPVRKQLQFFGSLKGKDKAWTDKEIDYWLNHFELEDRAKDKPEVLSKGNQQKVQIIMSFLHKPKLLILDEPFSGLDPVNAEFLMQSVLKLKEEGSTIIFSSHRMDHVEGLCDSICLLKEGDMLFSGGIMDLKKQEGRRKLRLDRSLPRELIERFEGVRRIHEGREYWTLYLEDESNARAIYPSVIDETGFTNQFSLDYLSLDEIFKKYVGHEEGAQMHVEGEH